MWYIYVPAVPFAGDIMKPQRTEEHETSGIRNKGCDLPPRLRARKETTMSAMMNVKKNAPKFIDDTHVQVTKEFAKNARIFGTPEYKVWRAIKQDCAAAEMVTKTIKKNPNKRTSTKNMTYKHMAIFISQQDKADEHMKEFEKQIAISKVQTNPYRCVLAWFMQTFEEYDSYKDFFEKEAEKEAQKKNIFTLVKPTVIVEAGSSRTDELAMVVNG